jgi:hypothetical protein
MASGASYRQATRHPWSCLLFVLPLLAAYEAGVVWLGGDQPESLRNGADYWLRCGIWLRFGLNTNGWWLWLLPALLLLVFLVWTWRRWSDRPGEMVGTLSGMVLESVGFALGLWGMSGALTPLLQRFGVELAVDPAGETGFRQAVRYLGSGIYEEAIFRLFLFSAMWWLLTRLTIKSNIAAVLAAAGSAALFSAAHHWGPYGQPYDNYVFLFRFLAGLYFAFLFGYRGFGIAVGAHACYNVMVSVGA